MDTTRLTARLPVNRKPTLESCLGSVDNPSEWLGCTAQPTSDIPSAPCSKTRHGLGVEFAYSQKYFLILF